jgi:hypothetical protein
VLKSCAKDLGMWQDGSLVLQSESEMTIFWDFAMHHYRQEGSNAFERYLAQAPPDMDPNERLFLEASVKSRYTIFQVDNLVPNLGANSSDLLNGDSFFMADQRLSQAGFPGLIMASRIIDLPGFSMSVGANIVLSVALYKAMVRVLGESFGNRRPAELNIEDQARFQALIIIMARANGATAGVTV